MKDGFMNANNWNQWNSLEELNKSYQEFLDTEYSNRIHSSLGISPKERYLQDYTNIKFIAKEILDIAFLNRVTRNVSPTTTVSIFNTKYEVPQEFIGEKKLELRYNPFDIEKLYVYENGKEQAIATPVKVVENSKRKRQTNIRYGQMDGGNKDV